eukprot:520030_1
MSQAVSSEIPYLLPAASIAYIHYLRNGNKSDACSVAICGYLLSSCFDSAIESNKEHISGFKPPANPRLQKQFVQWSYYLFFLCWRHIIEIFDECFYEWTKICISKQITYPLGFWSRFSGCNRSWYWCVCSA